MFSNVASFSAVAEGGKEAQNAAIRERLVHRLAVALDIRLDVGSVTELDWQRDTLLEIVIRIFTEQLADAVRRGMPRRYVDHEDDLPTLRGSLNVTRQFIRHAANPFRLACRFDLFSEDIPLNCVMKAAVSRLSRIARSTANQRRLRELAFVYAETTDVQVSLQGGRLYCLTETETERGLFQTKPDILIRRGPDVVHVIDTKWKRLSSRMDKRYWDDSADCCLSTNPQSARPVALPGVPGPAVR